MKKNKNKGGNDNSKKDTKKGGKGNNKNEKSEDKKEEKLKTCNFVKARHILCAKQSQIQEIYDTLNGQYGNAPPLSEFGKLAMEHSECSSKKRGGDLGYFGRGKMAREFEVAAFSTPIGQMSPIIKTEFGYHIILVEDRKAKM